MVSVWRGSIREGGVSATPMSFSPGATLSHLMPSARCGIRVSPLSPGRKCATAT
jgi:hypothetical protein